jgi:hypothetical protein
MLPLLLVLLMSSLLLLLLRELLKVPLAIGAAAAASDGSGSRLLSALACRRPNSCSLQRQRPSPISPARVQDITASPMSWFFGPWGREWGRRICFGGGGYV